MRATVNRSDVQAGTTGWHGTDADTGTVLAADAAGKKAEVTFLSVKQLAAAASAKAAAGAGIMFVGARQFATWRHDAHHSTFKGLHWRGSHTPGNDMLAEEAANGRTNTDERRQDRHRCQSKRVQSDNAFCYHVPQVVNTSDAATVQSSTLCQLLSSSTHQESRPAQP